MSKKNESEGDRGVALYVTNEKNNEIYLKRKAFPF
jgi:hypothetical protein